MTQPTETPAEANRRIAKLLARFDVIDLDYPPRTAGLAAFDLLRLTAASRTPGTPCGAALLVAPYGCGKTRTIAMVERHAAKDSGICARPVLPVETSSTGTTDSLPTSILAALGVPRPEVGNEKARWSRAIDELRRAQVELVMFDEFNRANRRATMSAAIVTTIRERIMDAGVAAVGFVGSEDATVALRTCPELIERLDDHVDLTPLDWLVEEDREIVVAFLADLDATLHDLGMTDGGSGLAISATAQGICEASNGRVRSIMKIVRMALRTMLLRGGRVIEKPDLREGVYLHAIRAGFASINPFD